jgi:hypothetical protein
MYKKDFGKIVERIFNLVTEVALTIWNQVLLWTHSNFLSWIRKYMIPIPEEWINLAFTSVSAIKSEIVGVVKQAWQEVNRFLLGMVVGFEKIPSSTAWKKRTTSQVVKKVQANRPVVVKTDVEEEIDWDSLPQEVRENWLKSSVSNYEVDFVETREKELEIMTIEQ